MIQSIKKLFRKIGLDIRKWDPSMITLPAEEVKRDSMFLAMKRMKQAGVAPTTIIDLGAAEGKWSLQTRNIFPSSDFLMVEPLMERKLQLEAICKSNSRFQFLPAAAGDRKGEVKFLVSDDLDGSGVYDQQEGRNFRSVPVIRLDEEVRRLGLRPPFMIKFDTHGFEVPIIAGASGILRETQLIIMECYSFKISSNCLVMHEMIAHMEKLGFRVADIVDVLRRPGDQMFWQCDVFFLRSDDPKFMRTSYAE